jgi:hypothetical protein
LPPEKTPNQVYTKWHNKCFPDFWYEISFIPSFCFVSIKILAIWILFFSRAMNKVINEISSWQMSG